MEKAFKKKYEEAAKKDQAMQMKKAFAIGGGAAKETLAKRQKEMQSQLKNVFFENVKKGANTVMHQ